MLLRYLRNIKDEFLKIKWISFKEVAFFSVLVIIILTIFSSLIMFFDFFSIQIIKTIFTVDS